MKIVILSDKFSPDIGGIESISKMLAEEFIKKGHEIRVITHTKTVGKNGFSFKVMRQPKLKILFEQYASAHRGMHHSARRINSKFS